MRKFLLAIAAVFAITTTSAHADLTDVNTDYLTALSPDDRSAAITLVSDLLVYTAVCNRTFFNGSGTQLLALKLVSDTFPEQFNAKYYETMAIAKQAPAIYCGLNSIINEQIARDFGWRR